MRQMNSVFLVSGILLFMTGCNSLSTADVVTEEQAIDNMAAPFVAGAITININARPDMNSWDDISNSCTLVILQTRAFNTLKTVSSNHTRLKSLFQGEGAADDVLEVDRYVAMPGQTTTLHLDRSKDTRYLAIIVGYYPFPKKQHMVFFKVPVRTESSGWFSKTWKAELSQLSLQLTLGAQGIVDVTNENQISLTPDASSTGEKGTAKITEGK